MTSASFLGMATFLIFTAIMKKRNCASQFIRLYNKKKQLQKADKTAIITKYTQAVAKLALGV
jgi:hypothetical protein